LRITAVTWRDLPNQSAGGAEVVIDRLLTGLTERGHHVTLVCGGPVADHEYRTVKAGGTFSQYLLAPIICMTKLRRSEVIIDAENGFPYFSPVWRCRLPPGAFLLQPALHRLSDTLLVSNLGRVELPGATEFEAYGVPRGRSAVAIGAVGLPDQPTTITLRARDLSPEDAAHLLDQIMVEMTDP
jgi:hypothetical protein